LIPFVISFWQTARRNLFESHLLIPKVPADSREVITGRVNHSFPFKHWRCTLQQSSRRQRGWFLQKKGFCCQKALIIEAVPS